MEFNHRPFVLHGLLLFFFVSIFLIHPGEEFIEFFFLLDFLIFILCSSEGLIIWDKGIYCTYRQSQNRTHIGASLLDFVLPFLFFRIVGIVIVC